jgi:hypothetical protein
MMDEIYIKENIAIYVCITVCIVGIALVTGTMYGLWSLVMLMFINYKKSETKKD